MKIFRDNDVKHIALGMLIFALAVIFLAASDFKQIMALFDHTPSETFNTESYETYHTVDEVAARLQEEIMNGNESCTFYVENISSDDISQINNMIDPTYGTAVNQETYMDFAGSTENNTEKITLQIKLSPAYYVYANILYGKPIPPKNSKAERLLAETKSALAVIDEDMSDYQKELKLHDYLVRNCKYSETLTHSASSDIYNSFGALVEKKAVCDGYAQAMQLLLTCAGVTSKYVSGTATSNSKTMNHAWNMVQLKDKWYHLDTTWDDPVPDMGKLSTHAYFNVTDDFISSSHTWDTAKYPQANSKKMNYYARKKQRFSSWKKYKAASYKALVTKGKPIYEAYIGKREVTKDDFKFLYKKTSDYEKHYGWNMVEEKKGNVLILTSQD